jgi:tetratricopeptide (TPR) repeat protein
MLRARSSAGPLTAVCLLMACAAPATPAEEGKRVALIIGNNAYSMRPLQNAVNDARAMDKALQGAGFRTILRENATKVAMEQAASEFLQLLGPEDTALFYYAGHAVQIQNENVLIPIDFAAANTVIEAKFKSFSLGMIFDYLKSTVRVKRSIVVVDACRSNPLAEGHSLQAGLAIPLNAGKETYIAFSTSPNHFAADNPQGRNSWFTEALADLVQQPGLTIDEVFNQVRQRVERSTEGKQTPWSQTSLTAKFFFHAPDGAAESRFELAEKRMQAALRHEQRENWDEAIELMNQVAAGKQGDTFEGTARRKLPYLAARRDAQARQDEREFAAAGELYEKALEADPFAIGAALEGVNAYLLADRLPDAVRLLHAVRVRGTSAAISQTAELLKELAPVYPQAEQELKAGVPIPPPIQDVFAAVRFGVPDFEAGTRYARSFPPDLARWLKEAAIPVPAPQPVAATPPPQAPVDPSVPATGCGRVFTWKWCPWR